MNGREAARSGEWAQHFSNASCFSIGLAGKGVSVLTHVVQWDVSVRPKLSLSIVDFSVNKMY